MHPPPKLPAKNRLILSLTTLGLLAASASINAAQLQKQTGVDIPQKPAIVSQTVRPTNKTVRQQVEEYFADVPMLIKVAECESRFRQYDSDGNVFRGIIPEDVGVMQINEKYWGDTADKIGVDLYTTQGNMVYARYLYNKEGLRPWKASSACWMKGTELAMVK